MTSIDLSKYIQMAEKSEPLRVYGRIVEITGILLKATGLKVSIGEACKVFTESEQTVDAEVVGFKNGMVLLMAIGELSQVTPGSKVYPLGKKLSIKVSRDIVGRVIDGSGNPIDGRGHISGISYPLFASSSNPLNRQRIKEPLDLGIRAINGLLTCGKGQRIGIMAGTGVGKSVMLGMISKYTGAGINVIALIGERGREVKEFLERDLGEEGMKRSVVIVSTSEQPPLVKLRAAFAATAIAEYFRDQGEDVLLLMDSLTRVAMAQREIGLAIGEPPTSKGYTPSVFAMLSKILERVGTSEKDGSITGLYTVLVEGDDLSDPVADAAMSILDGHIVLSRELAMENHYPAIDVLRSVSRVMPDIIDQKHKEYAGKFIEILATYKKYEDMITIGAYKNGSNPKIDYSIKMIDKIKSYMRQGMNDRMDYADSLHGLYCLLEKMEND